LLGSFANNSSNFGGLAVAIDVEPFMQAILPPAKPALLLSIWAKLLFAPLYL